MPQNIHERNDSVIYDLAPPKTRKRGRPAKHRKRLSIEDNFSLSDEKIGDYYIGVRRVLSNLFGEREILAFVTSTENAGSSKRLFFSTVFLEQLSMLIREQVFYAHFVKNIESHIKSNRLFNTLKILIQQQGYYCC